mmetsp:Transcript_50735/g.164406  ORF Transcript_50735/g.164406 Transcript_50735/m.164406 type:complete len:240 (-) Transcript_50735:695-1414(-)
MAAELVAEAKARVVGAVAGAAAPLAPREGTKRSSPARLTPASSTLASSTPESSAPAQALPEQALSRRLAASRRAIRRYGSGAWWRAAARTLARLPPAPAPRRAGPSLRGQPRRIRRPREPKRGDRRGGRSGCAGSGARAESWQAGPARGQSQSRGARWGWRRRASGARSAVGRPRRAANRSATLAPSRGAAGPCAAERCPARREGPLRAASSRGCRGRTPTKRERRSAERRPIPAPRSG